MLEKLRNKSNSWIFKTLLILIAASFFIFGIGDMVRGIVSHRPIAIVGKGEISMQQLDARLRQQLKQIQAEANQHVSLNDLIKMGLVDKVLNNMVSRLVIEQEMERLELVVSENVIRDSIHAMEPFQKDGQFDAEKFNTLLKNAGINQKVLIDDIRSQIIDRQYFQSFVNVSAMPKFYNDILNNAILSKRSFSILKINSAKMVLDKQPTQDDIQTFFNNHKANYMQPESRMLDIAILDVKKGAGKIAISENELKAVYADKKHLFFTPETRDLNKITFKTHEDALAIMEELKKGKKLAQLNNNQKADVKNLKGITKNLLDPAHQDIVFAATNKTYTTVLAAGTEFVVYYIESITPEKQESFEKVKNQLLHDLRIERYQEDYKIMRDKIEDELAGGNDLEIVAKTFDLPFMRLAQVTTTAEGLKKIPTIFPPEQAEKILLEAFKMEEGSTSTVMEISPELHYVMGVKKIDAAHEPDLQSVKEKVTNDLISYLKDQKSISFVNQLMKNAKSIQDFSSLAKKHGLTLESNKVFLRMAIYEDQALHDNGMIDTFERGFSAPVGQPVLGRYQNGFMIVAAEKEMPTTAQDKEKSQKTLRRLNTIMSESMLQLLIDGMKKNHKIDINAKHLNTFMGMISKIDE